MTPGGCADPLVGVVLVVAEAAAGALPAIWLMVRGPARSHEATEGKVGATATNARAADAERAFGAVRTTGTGQT